MAIIGSQACLDVRPARPSRACSPAAHRRSHLGPQLLAQLRQRLFVRFLSRPLDTQPLRLVWLRNHMHMHVVHDLVRQAPVILQNVVVLGSGRLGNFGGDGEQFREVFVRDVGQFGAVVFGDDQLEEG